MKYLFPTLLVCATAIVPLALVIVQKSNLYDDARHLYFVLPSLIVLAAIGWYWLMRQLPPIPLGPAAIICSLTMLEPLLFMVRNHPHEVMYFNPMIGGAKGAFKQYEMDYWGFSVKAAALWIDNTDSVQAKDRKTRVRLWYGEQRKLKYYTDKSKHLEYVSSATGSPDWDYWIELPAESKFDPGLLANWPPPNTIHEITVDGVPLCAIVRNPLSSLSGASPANVASLMNPNDHMGRGLAYYNTKDYNKAIIEFKLVLATDSTDKIAYNNIVAAYNLLNMYKAAVDLGTKVMKKYPDFTLLKNNMAVSQQGLKDLKPDEKYYAAISYNYFVQGDYQMSIYAAKEILKINPKSAAAYNNICAANNALGNYKAGKEACDKALILAPGDQLIKNNLAFSEKNLKAP
jgi:tetratricopeptide (TPR) repeat protein